MTDSYPELAGPSPAMQYVWHTIERAAACSLPVLVVGEVNTGHFSVARAIHERGPRHQGPFGWIECEWLAPALLDAELFGLAGGAFCGRNGPRGWLESGEGGTIMLNHVAALNDEAQSRLVTYLERGQYSRVGERQIRRADVRVISSDLTNLEPTLSDQFRRDLLKRLSGIVISLPLVCERAADIPDMVEQMAARAAFKYESEVHCSASVMDRFIRFDWPGNLRQLDHTVQRGVVLATVRDSHTIEDCDVPAHIGAPPVVS